MHGFNDIGTTNAQHLIAALEGGSTEVFWAEIEILDKSTEGPIKHDDSFRDGFEIWLAIHDLPTLLADMRTLLLCYLFHRVKDAV